MSDPIDKPYLETADPSAAQEGIDAPGPQAAWADLINFGVYNGNFRLGPPQAASNIDVASSVSGSNFVPGYRFVQSSNTTITAQHVRNVTSPSGSNFRFAFTNATTGHAAYIEQLVDVGGSKASWMSNVMRSFAAHSPDDAELTMRLQYLTTDGTVVGMPPEYAVTGTVLDGESRILMAAESSTNSKFAPPAARYLRVRLEARAATNIASGYVDVFELRRGQGSTEIRLTDDSNYVTDGVPSTILSIGNELYYRVNTTEDIGVTGSDRVVSRQLVAIPFVLVNVPANTTTEMQMADNALGLGTPRIGMGWPGDIVGVSYRMSAAITAGGATALRIQATVGGSSVWTAHTLTTSSAQFDVATQPFADTFTSSQQLGLQIVTSATFAPTTLDMACLLWVALKYDGL